MDARGENPDVHRLHPASPDLDYTSVSVNVYHGVPSALNQRGFLSAVEDLRGPPNDSHVLASRFAAALVDVDIV